MIRNELAKQYTVEEFYYGYEDTRHNQKLGNLWFKLTEIFLLETYVLAV